MPKYIRIFCALCCALLLNACLVPEKFEARLDVQPDGGAVFAYKGTARHLVAALKLKESKNRLSEKDEAELKAFTERLLKDPVVRKAAYTGDGRYDLELEKRSAPGETLVMFDLFTVRTLENGNVQIGVKPMNQGARNDLAKADIHVQGELTVSLPKGAQVISHNADSEPWFGMIGGYTWKIGGVDAAPAMEVQLAAPGAKN